MSAAAYSPAAYAASPAASRVTGSLDAHPVEFVLTTRYGSRLFGVFLTKFDNQPLSQTMTPERVDALLRGTAASARP